MNTCLLGYGRIGKIHFKNLMKNANYNLKYIYEMEERLEEINKEINIENTNSNKKIIITSSLEEILNDKDIKLCIICTPTNYHFELIIKALKAGKHIFCEKPLASNEEEIRECYNLAKSQNLVLFCALNRRFDPQIIKLKENIDKIGKIHQINTISRDYPYPTLNYLKVSSGFFSDCAIHDIDYVNWILADLPINVYAIGSILMPYEIGAGELDNSIIILEYPKNIIVNINISRISTNYDQRIEIFGTKGKLSSKNPYIEKDFINEEDNPISFLERYAESYKNELIHFLNVIEKKEIIKITQEDCINDLRIVEACKKSLKNSCKTTIKYSDGFRNYNHISNAIKETYKKARTNQTLDFVKRMHKKYSKIYKKINVKEIFENLDTFIDLSDPDISLPNSYHAYQTAEGIRKDGLPEWFQLVGLIHDIGKIIYLKGCDEDGTSITEQWSIVGDTFIVGCQIPENIIFPEFNKENPDMQNPEYNSKLGIYKEGCGLENVICSWGHDEYLYQILKYNKINLPEEALYIIRFHSLYLYHTHDEYKYFMNEKDVCMLEWLKKFNKYDLYTKSDNINYDESVKKYYHDLMVKYLNGGDLWI